MPEGPSLYILKEAVLSFKGRTIREAWGRPKFDGSGVVDMDRLINRKILDIRTWGKQFFLIMKDVTVRIHLLMFGSYSVNEQVRPDKSVRLALIFDKGTLFFYTCSVRLLEEDISDLYDWKADVMSDQWDPVNARKKIRKRTGATVCDVLLDQEIFSGVGNIIKNEVLYRVRVHPGTAANALPPRKLTELIKEARNYSFDFLEWKKKNQLKRHWLAYNQKTCSRCNLPFKKEYLGETKRSTFFCDNCQVLY